jgi:ribosomal subunit interface protein
MKIEIKTKHIKNDELVRQFIERKIHFALDRLDERVDSVTVRLEDETKDSKRFDGLCRIEVELHPKGHIHVSSHGDSAYDCVLQAIRKMEHATKHSIDRHRRSARVRHQQAKRDMPELPFDVDLAPTASKGT